MPEMIALVVAAGEHYRDRDEVCPLLECGVCLWVKETIAELKRRSDEVDAGNYVTSMTLMT